MMLSIKQNENEMRSVVLGHMGVTGNPDKGDFRWVVKVVLYLEQDEERLNGKELEALCAVTYLENLGTSGSRDLGLLIKWEFQDIILTWGILKSVSTLNYKWPLDNNGNASLHLNSLCCCYLEKYGSNLYIPG